MFVAEQVDACTLLELVLTKKDGLFVSSLAAGVLCCERLYSVILENMRKCAGRSILLMVITSGSLLSLAE